MFKGYLEFSQIDLANRDRVAAYVANLAPILPFEAEASMGTIHLANGEPEYRSPVLDDAPWSNVNDPTTDAFYGLYPLDITGIGDSTYAASTTESVEDGGTTQVGRSSSRDVMLSGLLVAANELAAEAGLTWLRSALQSADCADQCGGGYLRYFLAEPAVCEVAWGPENGVSKSTSFGSAVGPSPTYTTRWTNVVVDPRMPSRTVWSGSVLEGTEVVFGAQDLNGNVLADEDVFPLRRNYALNGTFFSGTSSWTAASGAPAVWQYAGGTDGGGYAQVSTPAANGTGPRNYGAGTYGSSVYGRTSAATLTSAVWATPPGQITVSAALQGDGTATTLQLVDGSSGVVITTVTVNPTGTWTRFSVSGVTNTTILRVQSNGALNIDDVLAEVGSQANDYFDGSGRLDGHTTAWEGIANASTSVRRYDGDLTTIWDSSRYLPFLRVLTGSIDNLRLTWFYRESLDMETQLLPYERTLHNVAVTQGPQIVQRVDNTAEGRGYFIQVEIIFTAGNPYSYSPTQLVSTDPLLSLAYNDPTPTSPLDDDWLFDPAALVPSAPPSAPDIVADAVDSSITSWQRYYFEIPADTVADWASSVPILQIDSLASAVRQVRVRFHPNPFGYTPDQVDPLSYCADFLISYLPARTSLLMNGMVQSATATRAGVATVPADSILYGSDGGPMTWPHLSCGINYMMSVDVPAPADYELFDLTLQLSREE